MTKQYLLTGVPQSLLDPTEMPKRLHLFKIQHDYVIQTYVYVISVRGIIVPLLVLLKKQFGRSGEALLQENIRFVRHFY